MNQQQLLLTQLLGSKELTFGCVVKIESQKWQSRIAKIVDYSDKWFATFASNGNIMTMTPNNRAKTQWKISEIIWHPATETDFKRWLNENVSNWKQDRKWLSFNFFLKDTVFIQYDSSKNLLEQSTETLTQIIELITNNS